MISYKRDVFDRQNLSEVKMGKGSPICEGVRKNIVEYFKNRGGKSTKIFYSSKSTITLLKFYLSTSKSTSLKIYSSKSKK